MFGYRKGPWKVVEGLGSGGFTAPARETAAAGNPSGQLYHLREDPAESRNRWASDPQKAQALLAELSSLREAGRSRD
jgi:hypothetical protein